MKPRIILSAIAVLAIVGGAMAFKANRANNILYVGTTSTACTSQVTATTTTQEIGVKVFYSAVSTTACPLSAYTFIVAD